MAPDPRTRIIAAGIMSFMMCGIFSGYFIFSNLPLDEAPAVWAMGFATTWPFAFLLACLLGPVAGKTAYAITRRLDARRAARG